MKIKSIHIYPIKSCGGIELNECQVTEKGLQYDRRWVIIDEDSKAITQRTTPILANFFIKIIGEEFQVFDKNGNFIFAIPLEINTGKLLKVKIWDDVVECLHYSEIIDKTLTDILGQKVRIVFQPDHSFRAIDINYRNDESDQNSLSDAYPILIISQASLDDLNAKCPEHIEMKRFRPNIVVTNTKPFEEDEFGELKFGDVILKSVKLCARCKLTTLNPEHLKYGKEPLKTLSNFRTINSKIMFGQNAIIIKKGSLYINLEKI